MKKIINKIISYMLILSIVLGYLPKIAFANRQYPVSDLTVTDLTNLKDISYTMNLRWSRPVPSQVLDTSAVQDGDMGGSNMHVAEGYDLFYRNTTTSEEYGTQPKDTILDKVSPILNKEYSLYLNKGSIYQFKIVPFHFHAYLKAGVSTVQKAPMDTTGPEVSEVLYLTDIGVSAKGSGKKLTVTWDNPTLDGKEIFTGYRIYYSPGGSQLPEVPSFPHVDVASTDVTLIRTKEGKLQYTFEDGGLQIGKLYAVKVEPMYKDSLIREKQKIPVGNKTYDISYTTLKREYRTSEAYVKPSLSIVEEGQDYIRLFWDSLKNSIQTIQKIEIFESGTKDFESSYMIGSLSGTETTADINFWLTAKPKYAKWYKIIISYIDTDGKTVTMESEIASYDPSFKEFEPYKPTIFQITDDGIKPLKLDVLWEAFLREPYTDSEALQIIPEYKKFLDRNIYYDIWISDESTNFDDPAFAGYTVANISAKDLETKEYFNEERAINQLGYSSKFDSYYTRDKVTGGFLKKPIVDNKVYYVKIVATRTLQETSSKPAFGIHYVPPIGDIGTDPIMISKPPLRIKLNADGTEVITDKSITIQWNTKWYEAFDEYNKTWNTKIGIDTTGSIVFGSEADAIADKNKVIYLNDARFQNLTQIQGMEKIKSELIQKGAKNVDLLALRFMDLKDSKYEIHTAPYDFVEENGGYEEYLKTISQEVNNSKWEEIKPAGDKDNPEYEILKENANASKNLDANTSYIIFFRPYVMDNGVKKNSYFPSFVVGTTLTTRLPIDIIPTVPVIEAVSETDTSVTVRWQFSDELTYTLAMSEKLPDYPDKGKVVTWETIKELGTTKTVDDVKYIYYTFKKLFPATSYYIWIRSSVVTSSGTANSSWSNPVLMTTKDILTPMPPFALGQASKDNVAIYNSENNKNYKPIDSDYIIVEWMRDVNDENIEKPAASANNTVEVLNSDYFKAFYIAKFNKLMANKYYFFRGKTIATITRDKDSNVLKTYNYVIQMSETDKFVDVVEITVPPIKAVTGAGIKIKESEWSEVVSLKTAVSSGEFDSDKNPDLYPLPTEDYEIIYDRYEGSLTYRFRTNKKDKDGMNDNSVDQRFISKLIADKVYDYKIDMSEYEDEEIIKRTVEIPYSIFKAFEERKISLTLVANTATVSLPSGSLNTYDLKSLNGFGVDSNVKIVLEENPQAPVLKTENGNPIENYASTPEKLSISVITKDKTLELKNLQKDIEISMKLDNRYSVLDTNISMYVSDGNTSNHQNIATKYDKLLGTMNAKTPKVAAYSVISKNIPFVEWDEKNVDSVYNITTKLDIKDMKTYKPNALVSSTQFNNMASAIAKNSLSLKINDVLSDEDYKSLEKSKVLAKNNEMTNEATISAVVRLYEIKTGSAIKNYGTVRETSVMDINQVSQKYQTSILKAEKVGLLQSNFINPKSPLKFTDMFYMFDVVMLDSE